VTEHRRPEIRFTDAARGTCRWCGDIILYTSGNKTGQPNRRRRWHPACLEEYESTDPAELRRLTRKRDKGVCAACGLKTNKLKRELKGRGRERAMKLRDRGFLPRRSLWELDHIVPLIDGGSHALSNLQTLCVPCHRTKTADEARERSRKRRAADVTDVAASVEDNLRAAPVEPPPRRDAVPATIKELDALLDRAAEVNARAERILSSL
jgi:5-methylcytosine-specific restriction endonuclease McrA